MAVFPTNILQTVQTYQRSSLGLLQNLCCFVSTANTKFKDFNNMQANLGSTVTFDTPPRASVANGLVVSWQPAVQQVQSLVCDQAANASFPVTSQQRIFNLENGEEDYMKVFGKSFMAELATQIEGNIAQNANSSVPVMGIDGNGQSYPTGALHTESGPFRFYGDGVTPINSYQQLATAIMYFKNFGAVHNDIKVYLPDTIIPSIVGSGLNQFVPERNNEIAQSWEVGSFGTPRVEYYQSNLLPIQISGATGITQDTLTLVSTNDPTGQAVTAITVSGAASHNNAASVNSGDLLYFLDGVSGFNNMRYLTYIGHKTCANPVQIRATATAASDNSGNVTISFTPALNWAGGQNQNLNQALQAGMQLKNLPSHRCGLIVGGSALYIAMPQLPEQRPFDTANEYDADTQVSLRLTYGSILGQNQTGMIYDCTWGSVVVPIYAMRFIIPLSQG
jgi:hypothetical protein